MQRAAWFFTTALALVSLCSAATYENTADRWPNPANLITYMIEDDLMALDPSAQARIQQATTEMCNDNLLCFQEVPWDGSFPTDGGVDTSNPGLWFQQHNTSCSSSVGWQGAAWQSIRIPDWCPVGSIKHEIGHALGLKHEHTRMDRNTYVNVDPTIIHEDFDHNYFMCDDCTDIGFYDYESVMHYGLGMPNNWAATPGDTTSPIVVVQARLDEYEECWWLDDGGSPDIGQRSLLTWEDEWAYRILAPLCTDSPADRFWQVPEAEEFECDEPIPDPDCVVYGATCSAEVGEATLQVTPGNGDSCSDTLEWEWSYDGSTVTVEHDIVDSVGPTFIQEPEDWSGTCSEYPPPSTWTFTDNCNAAAANPESDIAFDRPECANTAFTDTVTVSLTDGCGNPGEVRQAVYTVAPTEDAVLTIPDDIEVACDEDTSPAALGGATATDECDDLTSIVEYTDSFRQAGDCFPGWEEIIYRTWSVLGCNGVEVTAVQHIWVRPCCFTQGCTPGPQGDLDCQEHSATGSYCHPDGTCQGCEPGTGCCHVGRGGFGETDDYIAPGDCTTCGGCDEDSDCPEGSHCMMEQANTDAPYVCHGEQALDPCGLGLNPEPTPSNCADYCMDWKTPPTCHDPPMVECYNAPVDPQHDPVPEDDDPSTQGSSCNTYCMDWKTPPTCHDPPGVPCA